MAANIMKFDEELRTSMTVNVGGTADILKLAREAKNLNALVHVSTAFSFSVHTEIDEKFYQPKINADKVLQIMENLDERSLKKITPVLMQKWPNMYVFSKGMAENYIQIHGKGLPITIYRPSMVLTTYKEPVPGWVNNLYGPNGTAAGIYTGLLRIGRLRGDIPCHVLPADYCVNGILASGWDVAETGYEEPPIYTLSTSQENPLTYQQYINLGFRHGLQTPVIWAFWYNTFTLTNSAILYTFLKFFCHLAPGFFMDLALMAAGKKRTMLRMYTKIHKFQDVIHHFNVTPFQLNDANTRRLWSKMNMADREMFNFDMVALDWDDYVRVAMMGVRKYLLKDDPKTIPAALKRMKR
jgi:fatty acyl-CoA reductase